MCKCETCKRFYDCDNMGWWEECESHGYSNYVEDKERIEENKDED